MKEKIFNVLSTMFRSFFNTVATYIESRYLDKPLQSCNVQSGAVFNAVSGLWISIEPVLPITENFDAINVFTGSTFYRY